MEACYPGSLARACFGNCLGVTTKEQAIEILRGKGAISYHQTNNFVFYGDAISFEYDLMASLTGLVLCPTPQLLWRP